MDEAIWLSTLGAFRKLYNDVQRVVSQTARKRCYLCGDFASGVAMCAACAKDLSRFVIRGKPQKLAYIDATYIAFEYTYPLDRIIQNAKYSGDSAALSLCGELLNQAVSGYLPEIDRVIPAPLSSLRYIGRGYNQACEIARPLSCTLKMNLDSRSVQRQHRTPQSALSARARKGNIAGAFSTRRSLAGECILLVDDVVTTGATVSELARSLRSAGAACVYVAALAGVMASPSAGGKP